MKTKIRLIILMAILLTAGKVQAVDVDFYSDGVIQDGDIYNIVRVFDTPPDNTTADMFGGSVYVFHMYDSSTVNIYWGELTGQVGMLESNTMNIFSGNISLDTPSLAGLSILNIYGGDVFMGAPYADGLSTINIYGYGFSEFPASSLTGFLADGSPFEFVELIYVYSHMNLIIVPEPISAEIDIHPDTLNISSEGKWVSCRIRLPKDCNATGINPDSVLLEDMVKADSISFNEQQQVATVKFNRPDVADILEPGEVELRVTGHLANGTYFEGTDTIKVVNKGRKN